MHFLKRHVELIIHFLFWTIGLMVILNNVSTFQSFRSDSGPIWMAILFGMLMNMVVFYGTFLYFMPKLLEKVKFWKWILILSASFFLINVFETYVDHRFLANFFSTERESFQSFLLYNSSISFIVLLLAVSYAFIKYWIKTEQLKRTMLEEKLTTEMVFLKSQINPHFLFNVLNSFYAKALRHEVPDLADGISKLAKLMRYMVYETNDTKVFLKDEIEHLRNFIEIHKLRASKDDDFTINLQLQGDFNPLEISPMLLIPFVENAIKYGFVPHKTSVIDIILKADKSQLFFKVVNSCFNETETEPNDASGFGLDNLKKRLQILYPNKHSITTDKENDMFTAILKLDM